MVNTLVHEVETLDSATVETVGQLHTALRELTGEDVDLAASYRVELLGETLSDGSVAFSIRIREALPI